MPLPPARDVGAAAALLAVVLALFWRVAFAGEVLFDRDVAAVFHPQAEAFVRTLQAGSLPVWNPWFSFGEPMLANPSAQVLYPPTWLLLILGTATYYSLYVLAHLALGAIGMYALGRDLRLSRAASWTGGAVFVLSGPVLSLVNVWHHLGGACWMPWAVLAFRRALRTLDVRHAAVAGLVLAAQALAGSPDLSTLTLLAMAFCLGPDVVSVGRARARRLLVILGTAALVAAATAAGQWLPTLDLARRGARLALSPETRTFWSIHPWTIPQLLAPLDWTRIPEHSPRAAELFEAWLPFLRSLYLGAPALVLVAAAATLRLPWRGRLAALAAAAFLLALGRHTPVYAAVARVLPALALLRYPAKLAIVMALAWALLAAIGAQAFLDRSDPRTALWRRRVLIPCALLALGLGAGALWAVRVPPATVQRVLAAPDGAAARSALLSPAAASLATAAALLVLAAAASLLRGRAALVVVASIAVADLAWAHHALNPTAPAAFYRYRPEILRSGGVRPGSRIHAWSYTAADPRRPSRHNLLGAFVDVQPGWPPTVARALGLQAYLYPPTQARWGLRGSFDPDLLGLAARPVMELRSLLGASEDTPAFASLLRLGGVDTVVALHEQAPPLVAAGTFREAPLRLPVLVYQVPDTRPATYAVDRTLTAAGDDGLRRLVLGEVDPSTTVVLDADGQDPPPADAPAPPAGAAQTVVTIDGDRPDRLRASVEAAVSGWLVRLSAYDPGWRATVDGAPARVRRANHAFLAVAFPQGRHVVELEYRPPSAAWGLGVTLIGLATGIALARRPVP